MNELPKKFPEYTLMYKNLIKKIKDLENQQASTNDHNEILEIQSKIKIYQKEIEKIKSIFPENFFDDNN